jgi:prolyl oligopeptidase
MIDAAGLHNVNEHRPQPDASTRHAHPRDSANRRSDDHTLAPPVVTLRYPPARIADVVDDYHGVKVPDPYRWLEDAASLETATWVAAQNALTRSVLDGPLRSGLIAELTKLYDFPRTSVPVKRGNRCVFSKNEGLQNQPVWYVQDGVDGDARILLDPNTLRADGTVALTAIAVSDDGELVAYGLSEDGSDRQEIFVRDVATGADRADRLKWAKFTTIAWTPDSTGFYYTRFPEPGTVPPEDENYFCTVWHHRIGDAQSQDQMIFERPDQREVVFDVDVSDDGRWVVVTAFQGSSDKSEIHVLEASAPAASPRPLFTGFGSAYVFIDSNADTLFFRTDEGAPLGRIVAVEMVQPSVEHPAASWLPAVRVVVPQQHDKLSLALIANHVLVTSYLHDASDRIRLFDLAGTPAGEIALPAIGSVSEITGRVNDEELFVGFSSFTYPPASYKYDLGSHRLTTFAKSPSTVDPARYATTQAWCTSRDGTRVPMFLVHRRGLPTDGCRPVLMTGYGGFNISLTPVYDPSVFPLLDRGGIFAMVNLRGGGEYGEAWHEAGMFERKQNVFDDFIAAAEWLAASGYTRPSAMAVEGGSNGGLLTAAVMLQRPDLFGAVVCRVPVADMLRYHRFTVGRFWISEYGSAEDPEQFPYLFKYSPYHNVKADVTYPPILIATADTDDRVSPGMAKKFAARLQAANGGSTVLIRVETKAGHGAGKPVSKVIEEDADILTFVFTYLDASLMSNDAGC